jgi:NADH-quinone oxidoreductase subunit L
MTIPLVALAVPVVVIGLANLPWNFLGLDHEIEHLLVGALPDEDLVEESQFRLWIAVASSVITLGGILLAYLIYSAKTVSAEALLRRFRPIHTVLENKYYADYIYEQVLTGRLFYGVIVASLARFDSVVVDGAVNAVGRFARSSGTALRYVQSGQFQTYGAFAFAGVAISVVLVLVLSPL